MKLSAHFKKVLWSGFRTTFCGIANLVKNRKKPKRQSRKTSRRQDWQIIKKSMIFVKITNLARNRKKSEKIEETSVREDS